MQTAFDLGLTLRILAIGVGATVVMDAWLALLARAGIPASNFALLGRWLGHLCRGRPVHGAVAKAAPIRGEVVLGWAAHYITGVVFAGLLVLVEGPDWASAPTFLPALLMGLVTVLAPLLILQPAMGAGVASAKTRTPLLNNLKSLANHMVFGVGLYLAALASAGIAPHL
jgi:hypothetical protein